jgi:hypothetical protein
VTLSRVSRYSREPALTSPSSRPSRDDGRQQRIEPPDGVGQFDPSAVAAELLLGHPIELGGPDIEMDEVDGSLRSPAVRSARGGEGERVQRDIGRDARAFPAPLDALGAAEVQRDLMMVQRRLGHRRVQVAPAPDKRARP